MKLVPVNPDNPKHIEFLYRLLASRPPHANISHRAMPTLAEHEAFLRLHPYEEWCLIDAGEPVGATSITKPARPAVAGDELDVSILPRYRGNGFALKALKTMMVRHPRKRYVANVAHLNYGSMALFQGLDFHLCQFTFERTE